MTNHVSIHQATQRKTNPLVSPDLARFNTLYGMLSPSSPFNISTKMELRSAGDTPQSEISLFKDAQRIMKDKLVGVASVGGVRHCVGVSLCVWRCTYLCGRVSLLLVQGCVSLLLVWGACVPTTCVRACVPTTCAGACVPTTCVGACVPTTCVRACVPTTCAGVCVPTTCVGGMCPYYLCEGVCPYYLCRGVCPYYLCGGHVSLLLV